MEEAMRPRDMNLRKRYMGAAAAVLKRGETLTQKVLAQQLGMQWKAVRRYLLRYPEMLSSLGIKTKKSCTVQDYLVAIGELLPEAAQKGWKVINITMLASKLGVEKSTASRFLWDHPEISAAIPKAMRTCKRKSPTRSIVEKRDASAHSSRPVQSAGTTETRPRFKKGQEVGVNYLHEISGRMTFASVTFREYVRLWDKRILKFQEENSPRPEHLPSREEAIALI